MHKSEMILGNINRSYGTENNGKVKLFSEAMSHSLCDYNSFDFTAVRFIYWYKRKIID